MAGVHPAGAGDGEGRRDRQHQAQQVELARARGRVDRAMADEAIQAGQDRDQADGGVDRAEGGQGVCHETSPMMIEPTSR